MILESLCVHNSTARTLRGRSNELGIDTANILYYYYITRVLYLALHRPQGERSRPLQMTSGYLIMRKSQLFDVAYVLALFNNTDLAHVSTHLQILI